jgi:16S rRNA (uracil1498-N3)-methyltransferase
MRLTRVHVDMPLAPQSSVLLPAGAARHLVRVLRLKPGDALRLFNGGGGEFDAAIESIRRDEVTAQVGAAHAVERESPLSITLLQGIARGEKMDLILQKATELGVSAIVPLTMAHSTVRLDANSGTAKQQHWQAVVISACEQCERNTIPTVSAPLSLLQALAAPLPGLNLILTPVEGADALPALLREPAIVADTPIRVLVGPEGGFDAGEIDAAVQKGFRPWRLGPRVLRTETAGLAAITALQTLAGDLR